MRDKQKEAHIFDNKSSIYGPVRSWRLGMSLGIDPIFETSTCSFNCFYCQLGQIQNITDAVKIYVPTQRIISDFKKIQAEHPKLDVATYSGSGEPTLASNIDEMIAGIKELAPNMPQMILTNATELYLPEVRARLQGLDKIIVKIDAASEETFQRLNRPAAGVTLERVLKGIQALQKEYQGPIEVQSMFMPLNIKEAQDYADILKMIKPDVVQLNTPKRPYPSEWHRENRGNHEEVFDYKTTELKNLPPEEAKAFETFLRKETGLEILSIYK